MSSQASPPSTISPNLRRRKIPPLTLPPSIASLSPPRATTAVVAAGFAVFRHKRSDSPENVLAITLPPTPKSGGTTTTTAATSKRNVTERLQRLRRKLNPRPNAVRWRYRLSTKSHDHLADDPGYGDDDEDSGVEDLFDDQPLPGIVETGQQDAWETSSLTGISPPPSTHGLSSSDKTGMSNRPALLGTNGRSVSFDLSALDPLTTKAAIVLPSPSNVNNGSFSSGLNFKPDYQNTSAHLISTPSLRRFGSDRKEFRVRPFSAFSEPIYMTESEIYHNMMQPSQTVQFVESYMKPSVPPNLKIQVPPYIEQHYSSPEVDGRIGSLRVEVLGCVGLSRVKPDVAVYMVCGDSAFCTDVVTSCRSPMWPNVSRRAAVFALHHGYARLYVGVFDARASSRKHTKENDDFCGRVVLDMATLRPGTEYDVTFPLRVSSFIYDRRPRGVIRLRFSLHWFNERHAILSYWRSPHCTTSSLANRQPTIPCADPKTFRNVAVTVYGRDLPGKYSRKAFRATMREFNLYQQNLRHWIKQVLMDAVFYEKKMMSFYLFLAWMHCIQANSVRLVPAYFVGYLIYLFCDSYMRYNQDAKCHLGYQPVTLQEVVSALVNIKSSNRKVKPKKPSSPANQASHSFQPLLVRKKPKKSHYLRPPLQRGQSTTSGTPLSAKDNSAEKLQHSESGAEDDDIEYMNHREFPFSERHEYAKFSVDDALASTAHKNQVSANGGKDHHHHQRLVGRLSIYVQSDMAQKQESENHSSFEDDDSSDTSERAEQEDEAVMNEDMAFDDSDMDEEEEALNPTNATAVTLNVSARDSRRICAGPPQNNDVIPLKRIPPQVHLARIEAKLHHLSLGLADELVQVPLKWVDETAPIGAEQDGLVDDNDRILISGSKKKKKLRWDDFDKLLGLRERHPNPVLRITSAFLGPLMRMLRIFIYAVRVSFNVTTWRDPFLSFWVLATLILLFFILLVFPWRAFLFLAGWVFLGPQNILVRRYLEKKAAEAEAKENESETDIATTPQSSDQQPLVDDPQSDKLEQKSSARKTLQSRLAKLKEKRDEKRRAKRGESPSAGAEGASDVNDTPRGLVRPAFSAQFTVKQSKKVAQSREIVVPYSRLRKERFYDWPPDPTVSRATPISLVSTGNGGYESSLSDFMQRDKSGAVRRPGDRRLPNADSAHSRRQVTLGEFSPFVKLPSDSDTATTTTSRSPAIDRRHQSPAFDRRHHSQE